MSIKVKYLAILIASILIIGCKKNTTEEVIPTIPGNLTFQAAEFANPGTILRITPKGMKDGEDYKVTYYWKVNPDMKKSDTTRFSNGLDKNGNPSDGTFEYQLKDSLGTVSIYCYAAAENYSNSSYYTYTTIVKPGVGGSITNNDIQESDPKVENKYYTKVIGNKTWFRNNLHESSKDSKGIGTPFRNAAAMSDIFGRFYTYEEALTACPAGWRLPTEEDWLDLAKYLGADANTQKYSDIKINGIAAKLMADASFNSNSLWTYWPQVGSITNESELSFLPCGYANMGARSENSEIKYGKEQYYPESVFDGIYEYAVFWTADAVAAQENGRPQAYYRYVYGKESALKIGVADQKFFGANVRCVKDN